MREQELLSRAECSAMRGIAILGIVLHNYLHWLGMAVKENEYTFSMENSERLWSAVLHADGYLPVHLLSYFGHYGVPVFLFLSGYGLVMSYERDDRQTPALPFVRYHYLKLLRMMIVGYVAFTALDMITPGAFHYHAWDVIAQLLMYINILPAPNHIIWPGPYWFFGLMMELYIVYRLLLYRRHWGYTVALVAVCWLSQVFCDPQGETLNRLRYNCIGGMLPFGVGLLYARFGCGLPRRYWLPVGGVAVILAFVMCFNYQSWLWVPLMIVVGTVAVVKLLPAPVLNAMVWVGGISAAMFVSHPILRKIYLPLSRRGDVYDGLVLYVIAVIAVAWLFQQLFHKIPKPKL